MPPDNNNRPKTVITVENQEHDQLDLQTYIVGTNFIIIGLLCVLIFTNTVRIFR